MLPFMGWIKVVAKMNVPVIGFYLNHTPVSKLKEVIKTNLLISQLPLFGKIEIIDFGKETMILNSSALWIKADGCPRVCPEKVLAGNISHFGIKIFAHILLPYSQFEIPAAVLQVKTLSESHPDAGYAKTRAFYRAMGFHPLEEFKTLWGEANPCLLMVKKL